MLVGSRDLERDGRPAKNVGMDARAVTQAMLPLLREAPAARIVNVSSGSGSLTMNADPENPRRTLFGAVYGPSKTALNAITLAFAVELEPTGIKVNAAAPGFTATDFNNFEGTRTVQQAAREPVRLALLGPDGPTGSFSDEDGPLPWWRSGADDQRGIGLGSRGHGGGARRPGSDR